MPRPTFSTSFTSFLGNNAGRSHVTYTALVQPWKTTNEYIDYVTLRDQMLSYLPASKAATDAPWSRGGRQEG